MTLGELIGGQLMNENASCKKCYYCDGVVCKRNPPTVEGNPPVSDDGWCGCFAPKTKEEKPVLPTGYTLEQSNHGEWRYVNEIGEADDYIYQSSSDAVCNALWDYNRRIEYPRKDNTRVWAAAE